MRKKKTLLYITLTILVMVVSQIQNVPKITVSANIQNSAEFDWHLPKIDAIDAWKITNGSSEITIAVIDSGINFSHSELIHAQWINDDEDGTNGIDDDANGYIDDRWGWDFVNENGQTPDNIPGPEPSDPIHRHATFIAGLIAAAVNGEGIAGIAPNVSIMDLRVLKEDNYAGTTYEELGDAISYAVDNGADIISMSLQYYPNSIDYYDDIQYAATNGVSIVSITGNTGLSNGGGQYYQSFPGGYDEVISVGATNYYDDKADYSNYGPWTELVAPVGDQAYDAIEHVIHSTHLNGTDYVYGLGTSYACPQVSAAIVLMKSVNSTLTSSEIREILQYTATDLGANGKDDYFGYGMLNVTGAVVESIQKGSHIIPQDPTPTPTPTNTTIPTNTTNTDTSPGFTLIVSALASSTLTVIAMFIDKKQKHK